MFVQAHSRCGSSTRFLSSARMSTPSCIGVEPRWFKLKRTILVGRSANEAPSTNPPSPSPPPPLQFLPHLPALSTTGALAALKETHKVGWGELKLLLRRGVEIDLDSAEQLQRRRLSSRYAQIVVDCVVDTRCRQRESKEVERTGQSSHASRRTHLPIPSLANKHA